MLSDLEQRHVQEVKAHQAQIAAEASITPYDPFGKAGGGAPLRDSKGQKQVCIEVIPKSFIAHLYFHPSARLLTPLDQVTLPASFEPKTDPKQKILYSDVLKKQMRQNEVLHKSAPPTKSEPYDPFGKSAPERDKQGKLIPHARSPEPTSLMGQSLIDSMGKPGGGAPFDRSRTMESPLPADAYVPWGKPGGGAPMTDATGQLNTKTAGKAELEIAGVIQHRETENRAAKKQYLDTLQTEMTQRQQTVSCTDLIQLHTIV